MRAKAQLEELLAAADSPAYQDDLDKLISDFIDLIHISLPGEGYGGASDSLCERIVTLSWERGVRDAGLYCFWWSELSGLREGRLGVRG